MFLRLWYIGFAPARHIDHAKEIQIVRLLLGQFLKGLPIFISEVLFQMAGLLLPNHMRDQSRTVPEWFATALRDIDPSLIVFFNPMRQRWILDRCTAAGEHHVANHQHTPECPRTNVKVIQGEGGEYMPLCADVLDWLRAHDTWNQHSSADQFVKILSNQDEDYQAKLKAIRRANTRHATLDGKIQLRKAKNLIDQHDLEINQ